MLEILPYKSDQERRLDHFVFNESVNGTFLQSRQFLNYHPKDRFTDASFALEKSGTIAAFFPGNEVVDSDGSKTFISHQGSTFGGPVISRAFYSGGKVLEVLKEADAYLASRYNKAIFKLTPQMFAQESPDVIEYVLEHLGYRRSTELSSYTPLPSNREQQDPLSSCEKECRRIFRGSEKFNVTYRPFNEGDFKTFFECLVKSKAKHNAKPVHTLQELFDLQRRLNTADSNGHIQEQVRFRGIWLDERYVAGMMLFAFPSVGTIHAQYIAPDESFKEFQPTTCLYVNALREASQEGFKNFSWGISTEDHGNILNETLLRFKEGFGAKITTNVTYTKIF